MCAQGACCMGHLSTAPCPGVTWAENQPGRPCLTAPIPRGSLAPLLFWGWQLLKRNKSAPHPRQMPARPLGTGQSLPQARAVRGGAEHSCTSHLLTGKVAMGREHMAALLQAALCSRMLTSEFHELQPKGCGVLTSRQHQP